jgi:hypothetical protein
VEASLLSGGAWQFTAGGRPLGCEGRRIGRSAASHYEIDPLFAGQVPRGTAVAG